MEMVRLALTPHSPSPDRFEVSGLDLASRGRSALRLFMACHELAVNARKAVAWPRSGPAGNLCTSLVGLAQGARETRSRNDDEA
jgi:hypothetical protein